MAPLLKPPMLTGNQQADMQAIRDYLFRLAGSLEAVTAAPTAAVSVSGSSQAVDKKTEKDIQKAADDLRSLIIKTADNITGYVNRKNNEYYSNFVANSVFGQYAETVDEHGDILDSQHTWIEQINSDLATYQRQVDGQIHRGFITDPDNNGSKVLGIAIAQNLSIDATQTATDGTHTYYKIETQNFGLYTASGWQFWINGRKAGWFDANGDGILHVRKVVAEDFFQISGKWQMKVKDAGAELEFVYIGGTA